MNHFEDGLLFNAFDLKADVQVQYLFCYKVILFLLQDYTGLCIMQYDAVFSQEVILFDLCRVQVTPFYQARYGGVFMGMVENGHGIYGNRSKLTYLN